jgi:hypothetical protein
MESNAYLLVNNRGPHLIYIRNLREIIASQEHIKVVLMRGAIGQGYFLPDRHPGAVFLYQLRQLHPVAEYCLSGGRVRDFRSELSPQWLVKRPGCTAQPQRAARLLLIIKLLFFCDTPIMQQFSIPI